MSWVHSTMRAILAVCQPLSGDRATGTALVKASGADVPLFPGTYFAPIIAGQRRPDLVFKVGPGPEDDGSWIVTAAGTSVAMFSNIGGSRHNLEAGTKLDVEPWVTGIASAVAEAQFTGGTDASGFGAVKDMAIYDQLSGPAIHVDLQRSSLKRFPAVLLTWMDDEPADGSTTSSTHRPTRVGTSSVLYRESFQLSLIVSRSESEHMRREEGLYILDALTGLLTDRRAVDDCVFSAPGGLHILRRWREGGNQGIYQKFAIYHILLAATAAFTRTDTRAFNDWLRAVLDVVNPDTLPGEGPYPMVGDGQPGDPGVDIDMT